MRLVIVAFCLVLIAAIWGAVIVASRTERAQTIADAVRQNSNLAKVFEEHALRTIKGIDAAALFVVGEYARLGSHVDLASYVNDGRVDASLFDNIHIVDARGDLLLSHHDFKPANIADRDWFVSHLARDSGKLFISKPVQAPASGKWSIQMSRRISKPDGSFAGVVVVTVDPGYFSTFYRQADLGAWGLVGLVGLDGVSRARQTGAVASFGENMSKSTVLAKQKAQANGNYVSSGRVDGVVRYLSYRTLVGFPLVITVGMAQEEVLRDSLQKRNYNYLVVSVFTLVIIAFGTLLVVVLTRQARSVVALKERESQFRATFNQAAIGISHTALDGRFLQVNQKLCDMLGYTREEMLTMRWQQITHPADLVSSEAFGNAQLTNDATQTGLEKRYLHKDGSPVWISLSTALVRDASGQPDYFVKLIEAIAERRQMQQNLLHLAHYDALTSLPNRELFYDRLEHALSQANRRNWITGVLFVDLDHFKLINDTLGHGIGDELLRQVSRRLLQCVRVDDTVGRLGGDEFAIVLSELVRDEDAGIVAQKVLAAMASAFDIEGNAITLTASIGISSAARDKVSADTLVTAAESAMVEAKLAGKNNYRFYTPGTNERAQKRLVLEKELRQAVFQQEFVLHFQPKTSLRDGHITGVEALIRWQHPAGNMVSPAEFIPLLEETGLIVGVGEWVLRSACAQIAAWQTAKVSAVPIAVNLSARQFHAQDICTTVSRALNDFQVDARFLELEITESAAMHNADQTAATLWQLKKLGLRISIDDFGTGYSSLAYLKRFPIDSLKIDRSFVSELPGNKDDASIAKAVITMAHALRLKVIAEGVENAAQLEFLATNECDEMQGFYFSRPINAGQCTQMLQESHRLVWSPAYDV